MSKSQAEKHAKKNNLTGLWIYIDTFKQVAAIQFQFFCLRRPCEWGTQ